ncbi:MAG: flagellar biosynthesis protein FlhA [Myxococcota bacterium]
MILLHGNEGSDAAGNVIQAFGEFTVGGNYAIGIVIFLIFVIINMVVITKGAGRIAEVAARFTLDAMPGKQMAIDADLNQGVIDDGEARRRRIEVQRESDFYGAMDGASKFVKGDAIAGIVIMLINLIGGLAIGVFQEGMPLFEAAQTYTTLTVGDGLVSQVPALVVSAAAGVVVSRAGAGDSLSAELRDQVILQPRAMGMASAMLGVMALVPGLPFGPFAALAVGAGVLAAVVKEPEPEPEVVPEKTEVRGPTEEEQIREALVLDDLELEIGYGLIPLVDEKRGGELLSRIRATRRQLASELGFIVPLIHIRDNLDLRPGGYAIRVRGERVAESEIPQGRALAIAPGADAEEIPGQKTVDPAFGLPARWIEERDRDRAAAAGYAVVDASTALSTHLSEVVRAHAVELLTRSRVQDLLDQYAEAAGKGVEDIVPGIVILAPASHAALAARGRVSIGTLGTILDTLAEHAGKIHDPDLLTDLVRERLGRAITRPYLESDGRLSVITLAPELEEQLRSVVQRSESGSFLAVDPVTLDGLVRGVQRAVAAVGLGGDELGPVLLAGQSIRSPLRQIVSRFLPRMAVLSHGELPRGVQVVSMQTVRLEADAH